MAGAWTSSKVLTKKSWGVLKENRYLLGFPVLGFVLSLIPLAVFGLPALYFLASNQNWVAAAFGIVMVFGIQAVTAVIQGGIVSSVDSEFSGTDSSVGHGLGRSMAHLGSLLGWSVIVTIVSLLISLLRGNGNGNIVGVLFRNIIAAAADVMWRLVTFFVIPFIVLEDMNPVNAVKASASLFTKQWGKQLAGSVRIGALIAVTTILPGMLLIVGGVLLVLAGSTAGIATGVPLAVLGLLLFLLGIVLSSAMQTVYSVALFRYARDGSAPGDFTDEELQRSIKLKA